MKDTAKKIFTGLILTVFAFSNTMVTALAAKDVDYFNEYVDKPVIRAEEQSPLKLRADISITTANKPVTLSLRDSDVKQVLRMFADKAGLNIIFHDSVNGNVTLDLVSVPLNDAFQLVMEIAGLNYVIDNNTLIVAKAGTQTNFSKQEITAVPVKYIDATAMAEFLNKNIYGMNKPGFSSDVAVTNPATNEILIFGTPNDVAIAKKVIDKFDKKPTTTIFKVNHTTPKEMAEMICTMLLPQTGSGKTGGAASIEGVMTGGASGSGDALEIGKGEIACTAEGKTSAGSLSSMPIQSLSISYFTQNGTINVMGGSPEQIQMINEFITTTDRKQPQAYLELSIIELSEAGSKTLDNTWQYLSKNFSFNYSNGTTATNPAYPIFFMGDGLTNNSKDDTGKDVASQLSKYQGPSTLMYAINYLVENRKGRVVANPRILITNGQEATIDLTSDYVKTTTAQVVAGTLSPTVQKTYDIGDDNGIKVTLTPFISPDGYVTLDIEPDYSTIKEQIYDTQGEGEEQARYLAATLLQRRDMELKSVRIKDGETLVIGGMIREDEQKTVSKIPFLGDIPGIGMFFRSTSTNKTKEEMIIMITPKIIVDSEDSIKNQDTL